MEISTETIEAVRKVLMDMYTDENASWSFHLSFPVAKDKVGDAHFRVVNFEDL